MLPCWCWQLAVVPLWQVQTAAGIFIDSFTISTGEVALVAAIIYVISKTYVFHSAQCQTACDNCVEYKHNPISCNVVLLTPRRSPEMCRCSPRQNTGVMQFQSSIKPAGSLHVWPAQKQNFTWKMGSSGMWQKVMEQWLLFENITAWHEPVCSYLINQCCSVCS